MCSRFAQHINTGMISFRQLLNELKLTVQYHSKLNPAIWHDGKLADEDRKKLIDLAKKFVDFSAVKQDAIKDIVFTGSSANFNYTKFSDIDVHVLCDPVGVDEDTLKDKKNDWTDLHGAVKMHNYPMEFYIQSPTEHFPDGQGVFSLVKNTWLIKPVHLDHIDVLEDPKTMTKLEHEIARINHMIASKDIAEVKAYKHKLSSQRDAGLHRAGRTGGEFSIENVVFKELRNRGLVDKLRKHYHSLKGVSDSADQK